MKGFHFRLARLKRLREIEENAARERFLAADRSAREAEDAARAARDAVHRAEDELRAVQSSPSFGASTVLNGLVTVDALRARIPLADERTRAARAKAEVERQAWSERRRDVKGLERLEDRDRERWTAEEGRREALTMDEVASLRAAARDRAEASMERASRSMNGGPTP